MFPMLLAPLLSKLAESGMGLLSSAIQAKGKEAIEKVIGVTIPDNPTPQELETLKMAEMAHEEKLMELAVRKIELNLAAEKVAAEEVTKRWQADVSSDSWLSKNIRPLTLIFILAIYTIFASASAFGIAVNQSYVELLGQWGMLIMSAYFVGRTVEKGISIVGEKK